MDKNRTLLLSASDIKKKIERISYEILENCDEQDGIILAGIKESGYWAKRRKPDAYKNRLGACRLNLNPQFPLIKSLGGRLMSNRQNACMR